MRLHDLFDVLDGAGLDVIPVEGWHTRGEDDEKRGRAMKKPKVVIWHHDAVASKADIGSLSILVNGRKKSGKTPALPGPLCHLALGRSGRWYVVASGKANHAGVGRWNGTTESVRTIGIEAANNGVGEPWPAAQIDSYVAGSAALCRHFGLAADAVCAHWEWALPEGRKIDPVGIDMGVSRARVGALLVQQPPAPSQEDDMARTCAHPTAARQPNSRVPFYRWLDGTDPSRARVLAYNGADLKRQDGVGYGIPFMDITGLAGRPLGLEPTADGGVVLVCEDGGTIDIAPR